MERHQGHLLYCQTFDSIAKDHGCNGGSYNTAVPWAEREQGLGTAFTLLHTDSHSLFASVIASHNDNVIHRVSRSDAY